MQEIKNKINITDYSYLTIAEISELIRLQKISPLELVTGCLERIERFNPTLNAFITVIYDEALKNAREAEKEIRSGKWKGPLHGIPVGVKDFYDTAGIRTTAASAHFKDRIPKKDADAVIKLKEAGAIIIGKTNMHELGMGTTSVVSYFGSVHNPWSKDYVAGGSSGGSAAAVAAGLCYATVDTDAVGSCRLPASCCGVTGFKASYDLFSMNGILEGEKADDLIILFSCIGLTSRSIQDTAILLNALSNGAMRESNFKTDYRLAFGSNEKPKIGVVKNFKATDEVRNAFEQAVKVIGSLGYALSEVDIPFESAAFNIKNIEKDRKKINEKILFRDKDILLLPTTTDLTPNIKTATKKGPQAVSPDNTFFFNYYGLPAVSVPCGFDTNGLPLGLQIAGPQWGEGIVLDIAYSFQKATQWHLKQPK